MTEQRLVDGCGALAFVGVEADVAAAHGEAVGFPDDGTAMEVDGPTHEVR